MSIANTSQHLQVLEAARLVRAKKQGRFVVYSLADALVSDFFRAFRVLAEDRLAEIECSVAGSSRRAGISTG